MRFKITALFLFLFLLFPIQKVGAANINYNQEPDAKGSTTYLFDRSQDDPSFQAYFDPETKMFKDFFDYAIIGKLPDTVYEPNFTGDEDFKYLLGNHTGEANNSFGLEDIFPNIAKSQEVSNRGDTPAIVSLNSNFADLFGNPFLNTCAHNNINTVLECAEFHKDKSRAEKDNFMSTSNYYQRRMSLDNQKQKMDEFAAIEKQCLSSNPPKDIPCDNKYYLNESTSSLQVANKTLNTSVSQCRKDPSSCFNIFAQKTVEDGRIPYALVIDKHPDRDLNEFVKVIYGIIGAVDEYPKVITGSIAKLRGTTAAARESMRIKLDKDESADLIINIRSEYYKPIPSMSTFNLAAKEKVKQTPHFQAGHDDEDLQYYGGYFRPTPDDPLPYQVKLEVEDGNNVDEKPSWIYTTHILLPLELQEFETYTSIIAGSYLDLDEVEAMEDSYTKVPIEDQSSSRPQVSEEYPDTDSPIECPEGKEGPCYDTDTVSNTWANSLEGLIIKAPGGATAFGKLRNSSFQDLSSRAHYKSICMWDELSQRIPWAAPILEVTGAIASNLSGSSCADAQDDDPETPGEVNCNTSVPEQTIACLNKDQAAITSQNWYSDAFAGGGKSYFTECNNDVIARAKAKGVDPMFALAIWIHESAASNYEAGRAYTGGVPVEDFGVHGKGIEEDFSAQLDFFLNLPSTYASRCGNNSVMSFIGQFWYNSCVPGSHRDDIDQYIRELELIYASTGTCSLPINLP